MYYKVVTNSLQSLYMREEDDRSVDYKLNEYVYAPLPGTYLFVFNYIENVNKFIKKFDVKDCRVFHCECEGVQEFAYKPSWMTSASVPEGTVFAYGVKLLEEIDIEPTYSYGTKLRFVLKGYQSHGAYEGYLTQVGPGQFMIINHDYNRHSEIVVDKREGSKGLTKDEIAKGFDLLNLEIIEVKTDE